MHTPSRRGTDVRRAALVGLTGALLAGCMVGPDYVKPKVDAPEKDI